MFGLIARGLLHKDLTSADLHKRDHAQNILNVVAALESIAYVTIIALSLARLITDKNIGVFKDNTVCKWILVGAGGSLVIHPTLEGVIGGYRYYHRKPAALPEDPLKTPAVLAALAAARAEAGQAVRAELTQQMQDLQTSQQQTQEDLTHAQERVQTLEKLNRDQEKKARVLWDHQIGTNQKCQTLEQTLATQEQQLQDSVTQQQQLSASLAQQKERTAEAYQQKSQLQGELAVLEDRLHTAETRELEALDRNKPLQDALTKSQERVEGLTAQNVHLAGTIERQREQLAAVHARNETLAQGIQTASQKEQELLAQIERLQAASAQVLQMPTQQSSQLPKVASQQQQEAVLEEVVQVDGEVVDFPAQEATSASGSLSSASSSSASRAPVDHEQQARKVATTSAPSQEPNQPSTFAFPIKLIDLHNDISSFITLGARLMTTKSSAEKARDITDVFNTGLGTLDLSESLFLDVSMANLSQEDMDKIANMRPTSKRKDILDIRPVPNPLEERLMLIPSYSDDQQEIQALIREESETLRSLNINNDDLNRLIAQRNQMFSERNSNVGAVCRAVSQLKERLLQEKSRLEEKSRVEAEFRRKAKEKTMQIAKQYIRAAINAKSELAYNVFIFKFQLSDLSLKEVTLLLDDLESDLTKLGPRTQEEQKFLTEKEKWKKLISQPLSAEIRRAAESEVEYNNHKYAVPKVYPSAIPNTASHSGDGGGPYNSNWWQRSNAAEVVSGLSDEPISGPRIHFDAQGQMSIIEEGEEEAE